MNSKNFFGMIESRFPETTPRLTVFPSGAFMIDMTIRGNSYCVEYLPSGNLLGLSKSEQISPFFEGVDESFKTVEQLEAKITEIMKQKE